MRPPFSPAPAVDRPSTDPLARSLPPPGNPLFPSSFSNLSLKPWSRPSFSGRGSAAAKEIDGGSAGGSGGQPETPRAGGENNRDWAREMIGLKAGEKLSNSRSLSLASRVVPAFGATLTRSHFLFAQAP